MNNDAKKIAQKIVDQVDSELGIALVAYSTSELELLRDKIDDLLRTGVDIDELHDAQLEDEDSEDLFDDADIDFGDDED